MSESSTISPSEIGEYPASWRVQRFGSLFEVQQGKQVSKSNRVGNNQHPFLRTRNVLWGKLDLRDLDQMHFSDADVQRLSLEPDDLLICEGGDIGRTAIWDGAVRDCYYQNHLHRARLKNQLGGVPEFALYWLWYAFNVGSVYFGRGNTTTIPNLSQSKLRALPMPVPPLDEQRKIAAVLSLVQRAIEQQERLIELTTELKKALMHKLFTEGLRGEPQKETEIGLVPENWEVVPLEECVNDISYGTSVKCGVDANGYPVLRIPNVLVGKIDTSDIKYGMPTETQLKAHKLEAGDLLFVRTNGVQKNAGRCAQYSDELDPCYFASYLMRVRLDQNRVLPPFLNHFCQTMAGTRQLAGRAIRTADGKFNINSGMLKTMWIPVPQKSEQVEIEQVFKAVDSKLANHEMRHRQLHDLFSTLLHQLMTAQIRVNDLDLSALQSAQAENAGEPNAVMRSFSGEDGPTDFVQEDIAAASRQLQ